MLVINWEAFKVAIDGVSADMTPSQCELAAQVISDLEFGADKLIDTSKVPLKIIPNKFMSADLAISCANQLATMVPPFPEFRANPLFVIEGHGKLRLILDLSSPEGQSLNDTIDLADMPDITMAYLRKIADLLVEFGSTAHLSKLDHCAAFKLVPVRSSLVNSCHLA